MVDERKESAPPSMAAKASQPQSKRLEQSTLVSARIWDVFSPPPTNTFSGVVVPRAFSKYSHRRRISVDVYRIRVTQPAEVVNNVSAMAVLQDVSESTAKLLGGTQTLLKSENAAYYEECVVRVLLPGDKAIEKASRKAGIAARLRRKKGLPNVAAASSGPSGTAADGAHDDNSLLEMEGDHPDDGSVGSTTAADVPEEFKDTGAIIPQLVGWKPKYRFPVGMINIKGQHKTGVTIMIEVGHTKQTRELIFDTRQDANDFVEMIEDQKSLEGERTEARLKASLGDVVLKGKEDLTFLVEIVSGWHIPVGDITSSDPYVKCLFRGKEVHRTKYVSKTLDPIWTVKTHSLFLLKIESRDLFLSEGLVCDLMDFDKIGANEKLGIVVVPPNVIYEASGKRLEFKIQPPSPKIKEVPGYLVLRIRRATDYDIDFITHFYSSEKNKEALHQTDIKNIVGGGLLHTLVTKNVKKEKHGASAGEKKYRVRPGPDLKRKDSTEWMTRRQIEEEVVKESQSWIDAGSGTLGRLYVEVLGCDGLPNLDAGGFLGNKTDAFVALVYQDTFVRTDVIDDCLSPRWLPWSQRAFVFRILHSSSQVFLGVFDFDSGLVDDHDPIGRVSVDVSNFRPNTSYTVTYNLYPTARMKKAFREVKGTITLRLRLEIDDHRKFLLANLEPPPEVYVNVKTRRDFRVVKFVCEGKYDMDAYSTKYIDSYVDELLSMQQNLYYVQDAVVALLMWHGHFDVKIGGTTYKLPLHSINALVTSILLVERPQLLPSFCFAFIAWLMLAIMGWRRSLPDPWSRCKSYTELAETLVLGEPTGPPPTIAPGENEALTKKMLEYWEKRIAADAEKAKKDAEAALREKEENEQELEELGEAETDISTKRGGVSIDPLKPLFYPLQQYLGLLCQGIRVVKYVIYWEECYFSFWITTGCLILAFAFLFVPWFWIIKWSARIIVWTVFGPWFKLADMFYFSKIKKADADNEQPEAEQQNKTDGKKPEKQKKSKKQKEEEEEKKQKEPMSKALLEKRLKQENAKKLKAMKKYMFGNYITKVPILKLDRFRDVPLPESHAEPYRPNPLPLSELAMKEAGYRRTRLPGQQLVGDMIPQVLSLSFTDAPKGKATAHPNLLDQNGPGGGVGKGAESTSAAYAKIASVVVAAGIVTWFGVPLMASIAEHVLSKF